MWVCECVCVCGWVYCRSRSSIAGIVSGLRAGQSEVQIPAGGREFSLHVYSMGAGGSFTGGSIGRGIMLTTQFHLVPSLRTSSAVLVLLLYP